MGTIFLWVLLIAIADDAGVASSEVAPPTPAGSCPMNFTYIHTIPWNPQACLPEQSAGCCDTLLLLFGVGLSLRLRTSDNFRLPDEPTSVACLSTFQSILSSLSFPPNIVSSCFRDPKRFVITNNTCAGIMTGADMAKRLGNDSDLYTACKPDVSAVDSCDYCFNAGVAATAELAHIDGNASHSTDCFYFISVYAAGKINEFGPEDPATATCMVGLPLISAPTKSYRKKGQGLIVGLVGAFVGLVLIIFLLGGAYFWMQSRANPGAASSASRPHTGAIWYQLEELATATEDFSPENIIGKGGFGVVFKGTLADGSAVAVKKIIESGFQRDEDFRNEVEIISNLRHRNLVPLRGCCISSDSDDEEAGEGKRRYLVYEYMPNGCLDEHIFGGTPLTWPQRKNIILDVAKGLTYLHYGIKPAIYHRDIKATNILLDREMRARVADFGLAKQAQEAGKCHLTTRVAGTHGYLAPEYALYGQLTEKGDVYSFGIVMLEVMCGRKALDMASSSGPLLITDWAWGLVKAGRGMETLDPVLLRNEDGRPPNPGDIMLRFLMVGILCAHVTVALRPTIRDALSMLEGDVDVPPLPDRSLLMGDGYHFSTEVSTDMSSSSSSGPWLNARALTDMLR